MDTNTEPDFATHFGAYDTLLPFLPLISRQWLVGGWSLADWVFWGVQGPPPPPPPPRLPICQF